MDQVQVTTDLAAVEVRTHRAKTREVLVQGDRNLVEGIINLRTLESLKAVNLLTQKSQEVDSLLLGMRTQQV